MAVGKLMRGYIYLFKNTSTGRKEEGIVWARSWNDARRKAKKNHPERVNLKMKEKL